ncbi:endonuclease/exonuclease/phosphatase family protein [Kitasatospora sp. MAP5-34]|uniref:endonuclease/exonuclease/phosphatase family protein n=1 Tax=Kitasatospora sp. MAP5-34 TaxID=3035102 RepID=UPI002473433F|nr:endonuclease/exonuclease/phosphatase family protein [Kitasatospora sp. MAP5-34]MDH6580794.1 endonuclease/exonuclease/phosphatase (EEP) superfamily protein YafD [Kitasatospora sp. MAP5-34]
MLTVATWNVLHRIHAENWGTDVPGHWPDESDRIAAVTARLAGCAEQVLALQEVSGDQLALLRRAMPDRTVRTLRYPRVPRARHGLCPLDDPGEHLVLLVNGQAQQVVAEAFDDDPGKGLLAVRTAGVLVVATHVSSDHRQARQLDRLAELAADSPGPVVLLGDFNADRATVAAGLGPGFTVVGLPLHAPPTRPRTSGTKSQHIDHVVVRGCGVKGAVVEETDGLSDHNLLRAKVVM